MKRFALAGNPNCGKTTLFNSLTGSTAHVGNWPGVTVDKRDGVYKKCAEPVAVVDLPGIYSLSPYTPEEVIARNYIINEKPDCVINIVDATNLERNLYLTTQIMEIDVPMVVALNMMDAVEKAGDKIDEKTLALISSSFGGGMGRMREVCGAFSACAMLLGLKEASDDASPEKKRKIYERTQQLAEEFRRENGSIICREILKLQKDAPMSPTPDARTAEYYAKRPCLRVVESADALAREFLSR